MIGGLRTTTSRCAIAAAAGLFLGGLTLTPAVAADLGGDCCADLEERVAELEATTVRKGNRKVSVKLSGQVNRAVMYWDDGGESNVYNVDNINSSTRFRLTGGAKWKPGWSVNYLIEIQVPGANSLGVNQIDDDGGVGGDAALSGRKMAMNIKSDQLGTLWWGRYSPVTDDIILINLGGTGAGATSDVQLVGGGMFLRDSGAVTANQGSAGLLTGTRWRDLAPGLDTSRREGIRYDSPSLHGFVFSAFWGEDDYWDVGVHFAKQWNSVRVAFGLGYFEDTDDEPDAQFEDGNSEFSEFKGSASIWHVPTGLFASGAWLHREFDGTGSQDTQPFAVTRAGQPASARKRPDFDYWYVQAGIRRGFFSAGHTSIYGEYAEGEDALVGSNFACNTCVSGGTGIFFGDDIDEVTKSDIEVWGFGVVQRIDAAATELFLTYRHFEADIAGWDLAGGGLPQQLVTAPLEDLDIVYAGGRIKF